MSLLNHQAEDSPLPRTLMRIYLNFRNWISLGVELRAGSLGIPKSKWVVTVRTFNPIACPDPFSGSPNSSWAILRIIMGIG
jgi:hypothetical protein